MSTNPLILDARILKRLPVPNMAVAQMPSAAPTMAPAQMPSVISPIQASRELQRLPVPAPSSLPAMAGAMPNLPSPSMPQATLDPAIQNTSARLLGDQTELKRLADTGSGVSQIKNPFLRGLARVGDVAASVVAPGVAAALPGTTNHHNFLINQEVGRVNNDLGNQQEQAQTTLLDAQPQLRQMAAENNMLKTAGYLQHVNDQGQHYDQQNLTNLHSHGYTLDETDPSGQKIRPLRYEEMSDQQQAVEDLKHAQAMQAEATAEMKKAQGDPSSPVFRLAKEKADTAEGMRQVALGRLGLSRETQTFNEDKYYNPQPTAQERRIGDLGQSAVNQVRTMRQIMNAHPEVFGPIAGRTLQAQKWLGSQSPDAQRFLSASRYLADHSAGVFGSRSVEITKLLEQLTDPKMNPAAMDAALDQAETTAQHFVDTGKVHGKPNTPTSGDSSGKTDYIFVPGKGLVKQ